MRLGVIGYGGRARGLIQNIFKKVELELKICGVIDPDRERVAKLLRENGDDQARFYDSLEELVIRGKPDGLLIGTRCNLHTPYAIEAAQYRIPLFLEKPVAINMEQALAL
jgi:predicted dehydrogenase